MPHRFLPLASSLLRHGAVRPATEPAFASKLRPESGTAFARPGANGRGLGRLAWDRANGLALAAGALAAGSLRAARATLRAVRVAAAVGLLATTGGLTGAAWAQSAGAVSPSPLDHFAREWLDQNLAAMPDAAGGSPLRPEVVVGTLDSRLQLAPCARVEPYLPRGTTLWGRSRIGLRCLEGPVAWNVFLPVTVRAWGPGWVVKRTIQAQSVLGPGDAEWVAEVDWADHRSPVLPLPEQWVGMQAAHTLTPGQTLRQHAVKPPMAFGVGTQVRVVASGSGFELSATGQAASAGFVGQTARVKLGNGKIVSGVVAPDGSVTVGI